MSQNVTYGDKPWDVTGIQSDDPMENWLRYQACSLLGRLPTLDEAKELFSRIDINTRMPKDV